MHPYATNSAFWRHPHITHLTRESSFAMFCGELGTQAPKRKLVKGKVKTANSSPATAARV